MQSASRVLLGLASSRSTLANVCHVQCRGASSDEEGGGKPGSVAGSAASGSTAGTARRKFDIRIREKQVVGALSCQCVHETLQSWALNRMMVVLIIHMHNRGMSFVSDGGCASTKC